MAHRVTKLLYSIEGAAGGMDETERNRQIWTRGYYILNPFSLLQETARSHEVIKQLSRGRLLPHLHPLPTGNAVHCTKSRGGEIRFSLPVLA